MNGNGRNGPMVIQLEGRARPSTAPQEAKTQDLKKTRPYGKCRETLPLNGNKNIKNIKNIPIFFIHLLRSARQLRDLVRCAEVDAHQIRIYATSGGGLRHLWMVGWTWWTAA